MSRSSDLRSSGPSTILVDDAPVTLFGHEANAARLELRARSRRWRLRRAALPLVLGLAIAPFVALLPPHAPWFVAALGIAGTLAWRRWTEEYTVVAFDARCPRCDAELAIKPGTRLRTPHPLACDSCGHEPILQVEELEAR